MKIDDPRYDRNVRFFGTEGQNTLSGLRATLVGVGGLGSPLTQHLALLGVGHIDLFDDEDLDDTNRNRFVGARSDDPVPGSAKVDLAARLVREINPDITVHAFPVGLVSEECFESVKRADWVFGCFDDDGPRSVLNELCAAYSKPYVDLASDVPDDGVYGGRVFISKNGKGCLNCLDRRDIRRFFATEEEIDRERAIYGVDRALLGETGPSVASINGVVASLAATEFMVGATGMREPAQHLVYRADQSRVTSARNIPTAKCLVCEGSFGKGSAAGIERYLQIAHLRRRR